MTLLRRLLLLLVLVLPAASMAAPAKAESLTFWMQNNHWYEISLEFSAKGNRYWPGNGKYYALPDDEPHSFKISCRRGEQVCYGAWETGGDVRWGLGFQRDRSCKSCCYTCNGGETRLITLESE